MATHLDTVFVAGNMFSGESLEARPAYLGRIRQSDRGDVVSLGPMELPAGDFQFGYPRIAMAGEALHVVWAEFEMKPRTVTAFRAATNRATSLWHSVLSHGTWSTPERIATAYTFGWSGETGGLTVDASGTLHVIAWKADIDSVPRAHRYALSGKQWDDQPLPFTGMNWSAAIATHGDTVVAAVVDERGDTSRVMTVETHRALKARWMNATVQSMRLRQTGIVSRLAFASPAHRLLLAIGEKPNDSFYLDTIRIVTVTSDNSHPTQIIVPPATVDGFEITTSPCDSVVMLLRTFSAAPQLFQLAVPRDSAAPVAHPLYEGARVAAFPGVVASQRSAIAVFGYDSAMGTRFRSSALSLGSCSK